MQSFNEKDKLISSQGTTPRYQAITETSTPTNFNRILQFLKDNELYIGKYGINGVRDWLWAYLTYNLYNIFLEPTDDDSFTHEGQWFAQQMYCMASVLTFVAMVNIGYRFACKKMPIEFWVYTVAATISILTFDAAFLGAMLIGEGVFGLSAKTASYAIASPAVGVVESVTQNFIIALGKRFKQEGIKEFKENPSKVLKEVAQEVGYIGFTVGIAGGSVWQLVFNACWYAKLGPEITATLVANATTLTTAISDQVGNKILTCVRGNKSNYAELIDKFDSPTHVEPSGNAGAVEQPTPDSVV